MVLQTYMLKSSWKPSSFGIVQAQHCERTRHFQEGGVAKITTIQMGSPTIVDSLWTQIVSLWLWLLWPWTVNTESESTPFCYLFKYGKGWVATSMYMCTLANMKECCTPSLTVWKMRSRHECYLRECKGHHDNTYKVIGSSVCMLMPSYLCVYISTIGMKTEVWHLCLWRMLPWMLWRFATWPLKDWTIGLT